MIRRFFSALLRVFAWCVAMISLLIVTLIALAMRPWARRRSKDMGADGHRVVEGTVIDEVSLASPAEGAGGVGSASDARPSSGVRGELGTTQAGATEG